MRSVPVTRRRRAVVSNRVPGSPDAAASGLPGLSGAVRLLGVRGNTDRWSGAGTAGGCAGVVGAAPDAEPGDEDGEGWGDAAGLTDNAPALSTGAEPACSQGTTPFASLGATPAPTKT